MMSLFLKKNTEFKFLYNAPVPKGIFREQFLPYTVKQGKENAITLRLKLTSITC